MHWLFCHAASVLYDWGQRYSRSARCASAMATTARACARSQAADTAAPLPLPGSSCCLAGAAVPLTAPLAAAGGPRLGTFGHLLRDATTLVALLRACARSEL